MDLRLQYGSLAHGPSAPRASGNGGDGLYIILPHSLHQNPTKPVFKTKLNPPSLESPLSTDERTRIHTYSRISPHIPASLNVHAGKKEIRTQVSLSSHAYIHTCYKNTLPPHQALLEQASKHNLLTLIRDPKRIHLLTYSTLPQSLSPCPSLSLSPSLPLPTPIPKAKTRRDETRRDKPLLSHRSIEQWKGFGEQNTSAKLYVIFLATWGMTGLLGRGSEVDHCSGKRWRPMEERKLRAVAEESVKRMYVRYMMSRMHWNRTDKEIKSCVFLDKDLTCKVKVR